MFEGIFSLFRSMWLVFLHTFAKRKTVQYPDEKIVVKPRWRGRIVLTRDPDGEERCVGCYLCAVACPVDCISMVPRDSVPGAPCAPTAPENRARLRAHTTRLAREEAERAEHLAARKQAARTWSPSDPGTSR